ncbi:MAG TPA: hypothetical protein VFJ30_05570 [Phycisphaerae bacterium]|nr:hypothetical protein [Phycisphaerae bacterium]
MRHRLGKMILAGVLLAGAATAAGCAQPPVEIVPVGVQPSADVSDLAAVLSAVRTGDGRFDPRKLADCAGRLEAQLARMVVSGPTATPHLYPTYGSRWAYWYNARAAWSLKLALLARCPSTVDGRRFRARRFPLDGGQTSLDAIDALLLADARRTGDVRLAACVPGVTFAYAALPERPFTAEDFSRGLDGPFNELLLDGRRTVLDVEARRLRLPEMLWQGRDVVLAAYAARYGPADATVVTALRSAAGPEARRRLADAIGYPAAAHRTETLTIPGRAIYYPGKLGRVEP